MSTLKEALATTWDRLNPVDPGPMYLAKFMGFALLVFAAGIAIGAMAV